MPPTLRRVLPVLACLAVSAASAQPVNREPLLPLPQPAALSPAKVALGSKLFVDKRLSRDGRQSCASCHDLARGGADGLALSRGAGGRLTLHNTSSIYNAGLNFRQGWSGQSDSLERQFDAVIHNPRVFDSSWPQVIDKLAADAALAAEFRSVYDAPLAKSQISEAMTSYVRSLTTPSRFDRYLRGDANAISADEKLGYAKFKSYGCVACHQGAGVGGNMFQVLGTLRPLNWNGEKEADLGRFAHTGREADRHVFKVPSLRNVALTAPYLHDGSVATLDEVVGLMFRHQLGRAATSQDKELIIRFLRTLSGENLPQPGVRP